MTTPFMGYGKDSGHHVLAGPVELFTELLRKK